MVNLRKKLPPLTALTAFEAAARLSSFTRAAMELGVTQAAISRQIHLLEEDFGFPLFRRLHRKIELTDKGRLLSAAAGDAFNLIADTVADLRSEGADDERPRPPRAAGRRDRHEGRGRFLLRPPDPEGARLDLGDPDLLLLRRPRGRLLDAQPLVHERARHQIRDAGRRGSCA